MLIFFAGSTAFEKNSERLKGLVGNRLVSYHYMTPSLSRHYCQPREHNEYLTNLIMDSGAFSAWNNGAVICLDDYIAYCRQYLSGIDYVVNLDVIPAKPGQKKISQKEIERSASAGWRNAQRMLRSGIPVEKLIPVFHQNENFKWLERMVREFPYIGLSPANDRTTAEKMVWLDQCMPFVTDSQGFPIVKFHGFAVTSHALMLRYPWFSVDSASWCQQAGRGVVWVPKKAEGKYDYSVMPWNVRIGFNSPFERESVHFFNHPEQMQKVFLEYFKEKDLPLGVSSCQKILGDVKRKGLGFLRHCRERHDCDHNRPETGCVEKVLVEGVQNKHKCRAICNAEYIVDLQKTLTPWPKKAFTNNTQVQGFGL